MSTLERVNAPYASSDTLSRIGHAAQTLRAARLASVRSSQIEFGSTETELRGLGDEYWVGQVRTKRWVVATLDGRVVGVVGAAFPDKKLDEALLPTFNQSRFLESLWVRPVWRREGLGTALTEHMIRGLRRGPAPVQDFYLWVFDRNESAMKMYEKLGFRRDGLRQDLTEPRGLSTQEVRFSRSFRGTSPDAESSVGSSSLSSLLRRGVSFHVLQSSVMTRETIPLS